MTPSRSGSHQPHLWFCEGSSPPRPHGWSAFAMAKDQAVPAAQPAVAIGVPSGLTNLTSRHLGPSKAPAGYIGLRCLGHHSGLNVNVSSAGHSSLRVRVLVAGSSVTTAIAWA